MDNVNSRTITFIRHQKQLTHTRDPDIYPVTLQEIKSIENYDYIISSPYKRCRNTSLQINALLYPLNGIRVKQPPIYIDVRLSEYQNGKKRKKNDVMDPESEAFQREGMMIPTNEEMWEQFKVRADNALEFVLSCQGNALIVTHGIVVNYYEEKLLNRRSYARGRTVPFLGGFVYKC